MPAQPRERMKDELERKHTATPRRRHAIVIFLTLSSGTVGPESLSCFSHACLTTWSLPALAQPFFCLPGRSQRGFLFHSQPCQPSVNRQQPCHWRQERLLLAMKMLLLRAMMPSVTACRHAAMSIFAAFFFSLSFLQVSLRRRRLSARKRRLPAALFASFFIIITPPATGFPELSFHATPLLPASGCLFTRLPPFSAFSGWDG